MVRILKFKLPIENLPSNTYTIECSNGNIFAGEIYNGRLIITDSQDNKIEDGIYYRSVPLILIDVVESDVEILHYCFQKVKRCGNKITYIVR